MKYLVAVLLLMFVSCAPQRCYDCSDSMVVFVSSQMYTGDLGGLEGADIRCQQLAESAGLQGTFKAWLSDSHTDARDRFSMKERSYVLLDGDMVAENFSDLVDGNILTRIDVTERGDVLDDNTATWTNTRLDGTAGSSWGFAGSCMNWTTDAKDVKGGLGKYIYTNSHWTSVQWDQPCSSEKHIYCLEDVE